jgi:hypothetical protein
VVGGVWASDWHSCIRPWWPRSPRSTRCHRHALRAGAGRSCSLAAPAARKPWRHHRGRGDAGRPAGAHRRPRVRALDADALCLLAAGLVFADPRWCARDGEPG